MTKLLERLKAAAPYLVASVTIFILLFIGISRLLYPFDCMFEASLWRPADLISHGSNPYNRSYPVEPPYTVSPYGPAYYWMIGWGIRLAGPQFWTGRLLSLLCSLVSVYLIAKLTWRFTQDSKLTVLSIILFTAQFPVQVWTGIQRPDFVALALGLSALALVLRPCSPNSHVASVSAISLSAILMTGAILCRLTSFLPVFVVIAWLYTDAMPKKIYWFASCVILSLLASFLFLDLTSDGGFIWQQYLLPSSTARSWQTLVAHHLVPLVLSPATWVIAATVLWLIRSSASVLFQVESADTARCLRRYTGVLWVYFFLSVGLSGITSLRAGSFLNYWLEPCAIVSMLIPAAWKRLRIGAKQASASLEYYILVGMLGIGAMVMGYAFLWREQVRWQEASYMADIVWMIQEKCPAHEPCFSVSPEVVIYAGRDYYCNDYVQYATPVAEANFYPVFADLVGNRAFFAIVTAEKTSPPGYHRVELSIPSPNGQYLHFRD